MSAATRSGLLFGVFAFFSNLGLGILLAICTPLCGIVWGIGAGIATVAWSDRSDPSFSAGRDGAIAGAIAGTGAMIGVIIGIVLQFAVFGGQDAANQISGDIYEEFGLPAPATVFDSSLQWVGVGIVGCCLGLLNVAILAGAGAVAAIIYDSSKERKQPIVDG